MGIAFEKIRNVASEFRADDDSRPGRPPWIVGTSKVGETRSLRIDRHGDEPKGRAVPETGPAPEEMERMVREAAEAFPDRLDIRLDFEVNEETGEYVVKMMDSETGEIVRQVPPEALVRLRERMREARGILFDRKI